MVVNPAGSFTQAEVCPCSSHCPVCNDSRYVFQRDGSGREIAAMCGCEVRRNRIRIYNHSRVPAKFYGARLVESQRDTHNDHIFNTFNLVARDYTKNHKGILVMGPAGVGKTHLVAGFVFELIFRHGIPTLFQDFADLLKQLRSAYSKGDPEEGLIDPLSSIEVLVIDELGKGRNSAWEQNILDIIISQRYNNRKTTIFTSNYTESRATTLVERVRTRDRVDEDREVRDTLKDRVGPRIYSRLKEMCDFIQMDGPDRRESDLEADHG